jgi:hypothetical protein
MNGVTPSPPVSFKMNKLEFEKFTIYEDSGDFEQGLEYN